jgi:hypothetical protein
MKRVIFACLHNAGRSQMAAAFFNLTADPAKASVRAGHFDGFIDLGSQPRFPAVDGST